MSWCPREEGKAWIKKRIKVRLEGFQETRRVVILGHAILWETGGCKVRSCNSFKLLNYRIHWVVAHGTLGIQVDHTQVVCRKWLVEILPLPILSLPSVFPSAALSTSSFQAGSGLNNEAQTWGHPVLCSNDQH